MINSFEVMTVEKLWNDPYISKKMLKHHLDLSSDVSSRKYQTITDTVKFLIDKLHLNSSSHLCDFGCGPGLYTDLFQQQNIIVTGVDFSTNSISYARKINPNIKYIESNYLSVQTNELYDIITMIYCDFSALSMENVSTLLINVRNHLLPNGYFFFDVHNLLLFDNFEENEFATKEDNGFFMEGHASINYKTNKYYDEKVVLTHILAKGNREVELYNWLKCYTKSEITKLLGNHGFIVEAIYDTTYGLSSNNSDYFAVLAKKKD